MLTFKRILAALILWAGADMVAMGILTASHLVSMRDHPGILPENLQFLLWVCVSILVGIGCFKLSWAKIK